MRVEVIDGIYYVDGRPAAMRLAARLVPFLNGKEQLHVTCADSKAGYVIKRTRGGWGSDPLERVHGTVTWFDNQTKRFVSSFAELLDKPGTP